MNWGQQLDKCSAGFCHLKQFFPLGFQNSSQNISTKHINQNKYTHKHNQFNEDHFQSKLSNKKSLKKYDILGNSKLTTPINSNHQITLTNKLLFKYQSPTKNQNLQQKLINNAFSTQGIYSNNQKHQNISKNYNEIFSSKNNQNLFNYKVNTKNLIQSAINSQNIQVKKQINRPNSSYFHQQSAILKQNNLKFHDLQYKNINNPVLVIRPSHIINNNQQNQIRQVKSNSPKVTLPTYRILNQRAISPQPIRYINNQIDKLKTYKQKDQSTQIRLNINHEINKIQTKDYQISQKSIENVMSSKNFQDSQRDHRQYLINSEEFWNDQKCNFAKKKTVSVLELVQPLLNFEAIQQQNQINQESRFVKGSNQYQQYLKRLSNLLQKDHQQKQYQNFNQIFNSNTVQKAFNMKKINQQKQKPKKVYFAQIKEAPLYIREVESFSQSVEPVYRNKNLNEQSIIGAQTLGSTTPRKYQFDLQFQNSIILKRQINIQEQQINGKNAQFISQTALLSESKQITSDNQLKFLERKEYHQPSIALKLFQKQFRNQKINTMYLSQSQNNSLDLPNLSNQEKFALLKQKINKNQQQKQNLLKKPICRQKEQKNKGIIKNYDSYGRNQKQNLPFSPNNIQKRIKFEIFRNHNENNHNIKIKTYKKPYQIDSQKDIQNYKKNEHNRIQTFNFQQTINSLFDEDQYDKVYPVSRTDFFVSKNIIDINSTNIINSPRNMDKRDQSTVIGRHCFSKPLFKLL